ncbi:sensor histidine kinase [Chitinophaga skermanii]|nr:histidine kinase [Chitinophaga skermanii]
MSLFIAYLLGEQDFGPRIVYVIGAVVIGILVTHSFRWVIVKLKMLEMPFEKAMIYFFFGIILATFFISFPLSWLGVLLFARHVTLDSFYDKFTLSYPQIIVFVFLWALIYFTWHYVEKNRNSQLDKLRLESTVRELELKTIKAQMNPHFIFNALNSIRALVDENPQRARSAITELSNILRSSMAADKAEIVSLENELNIVKDYLALETIRFEERLKVVYAVDPETLELPIPPMMLQTLVENAIKHGISKEIYGGEIRIESTINSQQQHVLTIQNTGQIVENKNGNGFGLLSTRQRLGLLFGSRASFEIFNLDDHTVEAKVIMPLY